MAETLRAESYRGMGAIGPAQRDFSLCADRLSPIIIGIVQTFTLGFGRWLRCLATRSPLVRVSDRIEAAALLFVVVVALLAAPLVGAVGTGIHDDLARRFAMERAARHEIAATVSQDSVLAPATYEKPFVTSIRWQFSGTTHTQEVRTDRMKAGERMTIWVDGDGKPTTKPLTSENAATEAVVTSVGLWFAAVGLASAAWIVLRLRLNRARYARWDRELDDLADDGGRPNYKP